MSKNSHQKHEHQQVAKHHQTEQAVEPHEDYEAGLWGDIIIIFLIVGLGLFFVLPFYALVPSAGGLVIMIIFLLIIVAFAAALWRRKRRKK